MPSPLSVLFLQRFEVLCRRDPQADGILRLSDGVFIPEDPRNTDWRAYLATIASCSSQNPVAAYEAGIQQEASARQADADKKGARFSANDLSKKLP